MKLSLSFYYLQRLKEQNKEDETLIRKQQRDGVEEHASSVYSFKMMFLEVDPDGGVCSARCPGSQG
jgi:hypothetical protein